MEDCVEGVIEGKPFLDDGDKYVGGHRRPNLNLHRVRRSAPKALDPQMLLDPFEEQFDLPTLMVDSRYGLCGNLKIVRDEDESLIDISRVKGHTAEQRGKVLLGKLACENDGLVGSHTG